MLTLGEKVNGELELRAGTVLLEKYRFVRLLGEGGQGEVWQAHNLLLDLPIAIKILRSEGEDESLVERLFREARAAASLGHPAIVRVFDVGRAPGGTPFLVMELLEGQDLSDRLVSTKRLAPELAVRLLLPIAHALLTAHERGIIHRDVKPENVFISVSGDTVQPKLLDFGIAKVPKNPRITQTGAIVGSPAYLSPEQARAEREVDERSDIWAFSATLYQCVTGELPFEGTTWRDIREKILECEPLSLFEHGVEDAKLWQILRRGLAKSKDDRWPDMLALGRALACWLLERGVTADVCGGALEARWLSYEPLAIELSPGARPRALVAEARAAVTEAREKLREGSAEARAPAAPLNLRFLETKGKWLGVAALTLLAAALASRMRSEPSPAIRELVLATSSTSPSSEENRSPTSANAAPAPSPSVLEGPRSAPQVAASAPDPVPSVTALEPRAPEPTEAAPAPKPTEPTQPVPRKPPTPTPKTTPKPTPPLDLLDPYSGG